MKKIILLRHECRDPVLRLWNTLRIRAFALETGAHLIDCTRFEYTLILKWLHALAISLFLRIVRPKGMIWWTSAEPFYLPPTADVPVKFRGAFAELKTLYFAGWSFRNPEGMRKHREALVEILPHSLRQTQTIQKGSIDKEKIAVGIYQRLRPFPYFPQGKFLVPPERMQEIIQEYLNERHSDREYATFIKVDDQSRSFKEKLALLAQCDVVIGPNDPLPNLAAWLGNIPHIVALNEPVDWAYYQGKTEYFENKYATLVVGLRRHD